MSKATAIAFVGVLGAALSLLGVSAEWDWAGLALNLGSGFVGSFTTYLLFDTFIAAREERARRVAEMVSVFHSRDIDQKNYVISNWPKDNAFENVSVYGADLSSTEWEGIDCRLVEFAFCRFNGAIFEEVRFMNCRFKNVSFDGSTGSKSRFLDCSFEGCTWADSLWPSDSFSPTTPPGVAIVSRGASA